MVRAGQSGCLMGDVCDVGGSCRNMTGAEAAAWHGQSLAAQADRVKHGRTAKGEMG